jgi:hypothetical protein
MPQIVVSRVVVEMMRKIEVFILAYEGDDPLHEIELAFPSASYRAFFPAWGRTRDPLRWLDAGSRA